MCIKAQRCKVYACVSKGKCYGAVEAEFLDTVERNGAKQLGP